MALSRHFDLDVGFFSISFWPIVFNALLRRMVLVGPRNSNHTLRGLVLILNQRICGTGGEKYAYGVALSRHFNLDVGFFSNIFWPNVVKCIFTSNGSSGTP